VSGQQQARPPVLPISGLGLLTIVAYGACYYAYGVLIQPIGADTPWPDAALGAIFSAILVITGVLGTMAGHLLDRHGPRLVFLLAAVAGTGGMLAHQPRVRCSRSPSPTPAAAAWSGRSAFTTSRRRLPPEPRPLRPRAPSSG
jgi:MFS family permease